MTKPSNQPDTPHVRAVSRVVPDTVALKALTHPVRLKMLGLLRLDGPATATQMAEKLGLNSGATSYHLRQLAQHGFIEDLPGPSRRDRWWRARHEMTAIQSETAEGDALQADMAFTQAALSWQVGQMQEALDEYPSLPLAWRRASSASDYVVPLNPEQAAALTQKIAALIEEALQTAPAPGSALPEGTLPFSLHLHAFPYPGRAKSAEQAE